MTSVAALTGTKRARQWTYENDDFPEPAYRDGLGTRFYCGWQLVGWLTDSGRLAQARNMEDAIIRWLVRSKAPGRPRTSALYP
jgi:hypothetical protein